MTTGGLEREINDPEEFYKLCSDARELARLAHDQLEASLASLRPAMVNALRDRGQTSLEARNNIRRVLKGLDDAVKAFNAAAVSAPRSWKMHQQLISEPARHRSSGRVYKIPERKGA